MKNVLITGANGFIGKNLVELLGDKYLICCPSRYDLDLLITEQVEDYLIENRIDIILHTANINNTRKKNTSDFDSLDGNLRMYMNLARNNKLYDKMYYFGSGAEYDMSHYIPNMKEEYFNSYIPKDAYGFSKYIMSEMSRKSENIYDLTLFGVYGKYEEWERRFISNAICRVLFGMPITIQKNVYFDYLWVEDLSRIIGWFIEHEQKYKHYNVCSGRKIDLYSLAVMIRDIMGVSCDIKVYEEGLKPEYTGDNQRLLEEIGNYHFADYEITIQKLVDYYKENLQYIDREKLI